METIDPPHSRLKKVKRKQKERKKERKKEKRRGGETNKRNLQLHALSTHTYKERSKASKLSKKFRHSKKVLKTYYGLFSV